MRFRVSSMVILSTLLMLPISCGDDPTAPAPETGTIVIDVLPDSLDAAWTIEGPGNYSFDGNGNSTLTDLVVGDYTVFRRGAAGWLSPVNETQTLTADVSVTFSGVYLELPSPPAGFVSVPNGSFKMGSPTDEIGRASTETEHRVTLTTPINMSATEITNRQYAVLAQWAYANGYCTTIDISLLDALDGSTQQLLDLNDPKCEISFIAGKFIVDMGREEHPVQEVTWYGSVAYCDWLSLKAGLPRAYDHSGDWPCNGGDPYNAQGYRLPTSAEWEHACRAGSRTAFANGEITNPDGDDPVLDEIGWYRGNSDDWTNPVHPVETKITNAWGLHDMHGNLYEWCNDWYGSYSGDETDPLGSATGNYRVARSGCGISSVKHCRSAYRFYYPPGFSGIFIGFIGFRPVLSAN